MLKTQIAHKLAVLTTVLVAVLALGGGVFAVQSGSIGGEPANPRADNPRTESIFIYELQPGEVAEDAIRLINNADESRTLRVYPVDSLVSSGGAFGCEQRVDERDEVSSWIELAQEEVVLEPRSTQEIAFTVTVPETASVGEQNGCIAIEGVDEEPEDVTENISINFRSAIRLAVTVPGDIKRELSIKSLTVDQNDDQIRATPAFTNTGNVSLDTDVNVKLNSVYGRTIAADNNTFPIIANIGEASFNINFDKPYWGGLYEVTARASYGADGESGETDTLSQYIWVMPETGALIVEVGVLVLLLGLLIWMLWRRHSRKKMQNNWQSYEVAEGDTLPAVAESYGVSWKKLAKVNKLSPPYALELKQSILVPPVTDNTTGSDEPQDVEEDNNQDIDEDDNE
jgi:hypothetical protein